MMVQWHDCKSKATDALLLFRLGDFYEAFHEDAHLLAKELDLTLTKRQQVPMSGIPAHTAESYIEKLVAKGYRVAVAEQIESSKGVKGLVKRDITRIITPGTACNALEKGHNYFASLTQVGSIFGIAFFDLSCADCRVIEVNSMDDAIHELNKMKPKELLISSKLQDKYPVLKSSEWLLDVIEDWRFDHELNYGFLTQTLKVHSLDGFGLKGLTASINAAGALLAYVKDTLYHDLGPLQAIIPYSRDNSLRIDPTTLKNLDLIDSTAKKQTLLHVIDQTETPMGSRLIKRWLLHPLQNLEEISARQDTIENLLTHPEILNEVRAYLSEIKDIERLITRILSPNASPRDIMGLKMSLIPIPAIKEALTQITSPLFAKQVLFDFVSLVHCIDQALVAEPPLRITDGGIFREGYHYELDELRNLSKESKTWMAAYQEKIRENTGIKTLKVGYSQVGGFFIEVSKGQTEKVPPEFKRRQTLTNAERYITLDLKNYEDKILNAEEKMLAIECELFQTLKNKIGEHSQAIMQTAQSLAVIDAITSLAEVAKKNRYTRPTVDKSSNLIIKDGRHPVIETACLNETFQPNDTHLDGISEKMMLITGPNMAGKSTYIRQVALIVIMAHMGAFVPASSATIGLIDQVFTRIGASDDLARGQSTFMVEMSETASILHNATSSSLVILDEIGRGTSTYDGIALAWSIAEYLLTTKGPKTLFATHYWELTQLENKGLGAVNYNVAVLESGQQVLFLRKIVRGGTDKSYGIHVARLAGMPPQVLIRAQEILQHLENGQDLFETTRPKKVTSNKPSPNPLETQLRLI